MSLGRCIIIFCANELTDLCDATFLNFLLRLNALQQVFAERRLEEYVEVLGVKYAFHHLHPGLSDAVTISTKMNHLWHVQRTLLQAACVLILHYFFAVTYALGNTRRLRLLLR